MITSSLRKCALLAISALGICLLPVAGQAGWRGGVFIGLPPVVVAPPAYYPPPYYYAPGYYPPPPAYSYAPPGGSAPPAANQQREQARANAPYGSTCYAGVYVCPAPSGARVEDDCSCPGIGAPSFGAVR